MGIWSGARGRVVHYKKFLFALLIIPCLLNAGEPKAPGSLFIFISFSMPDKLLQDYVVDAQKTQSTLVLQGLYQNSFAKTKNKIHSFFNSANTTANVIIAPILFAKYQIISAPTLMLTSQSLDSCKEGADPASFDLIHGAITVQHALNTIERSGDQSGLARKYLLKLGSRL